MFEFKTTIEPPYTNRWGCVPKPDYRRCAGTTKRGTQCRCGAHPRGDFCAAHIKQLESISLERGGA